MVFWVWIDHLSEFLPRSGLVYSNFFFFYFAEKCYFYLKTKPVGHTWRVEHQHTFTESYDYQRQQQCSGDVSTVCSCWLCWTCLPRHQLSLFSCLCSPCASGWRLFESSCFSHAWSCSCQIVGLYIDARWLRPSPSLMQFYFSNLPPVTAFSWLVFLGGFAPWSLTRPLNCASASPGFSLSFPLIVKVPLNILYGWSELQGLFWYFDKSW